MSLAYGATTTRYALKLYDRRLLFAEAKGSAQALAKATCNRYVKTRIEENGHTTSTADEPGEPKIKREP